MKPLTPEQRAAKFATGNAKSAPGLRSRGHRKLTLDEQQALLDEIKTQSPQQRLDNLRILREASRSSNTPNKVLEKAIFEQSVEQYIHSRSFENVPHVLGHLCTIEGTSTYWRQLYVIALANKKQFEAALRNCSEPLDEQYICSVLNMDVPLWNSLTRAQTDETSQILMNQLRPEIEAYTDRLKIAYRHPTKARN